jgi:hypothetical protein
MGEIINLCTRRDMPVFSVFIFLQKLIIKMEKEKGKYKLEMLKCLPEKIMIAKTGVWIANELHMLNKILKSKTKE